MLIYFFGFHCYVFWALQYLLLLLFAEPKAT